MLISLLSVFTFLLPTDSQVSILQFQNFQKLNINKNAKFVKYFNLNDQPIITGEDHSWNIPSFVPCGVPNDAR